MKQYIVDLKELDRFRAGNGALTSQNLLGSLVSLASDPDDPGAILVHNHEGQPCGILPRRGDLCRAILAGAQVGHISWQGITEAPGGPPIKLRVRAVLVDDGEHFEMPPVAPPRVYKVGLVGEANYQPSIRRCSVGQRVHVVHEPDNPYDEHALAVVTEDSDTIGYIARDSWLQDAVHEERKGCDATIKGIHTGDAGMAGVVLDVSLNGLGIREQPFKRAPSLAGKRNSRSPPGSQKGFFARLFGL